MRIKTITGIGIISLLFCLTGCGNAIPEMNEQQEKLVVEYMAGTLLKYDVNHVSKLIQLPLEQEETIELAEQAESELPQDDREDSLSFEEIESAEELENVEEPVVVSIDEFLGMEEASIQYTGYAVADYYPEQGEEFYFVMDASEGNQLLILKFEITNTAMQDISVDMTQRNVRFKIRVNGDEANALNTMLMNDLRYYQGMLTPGEKEELVLVREIPAGSEGRIDVLELTMKSGDNTATILLN